MHGPMNIKLIS